MKENNELSEQWHKTESMLAERFGKTPNMEAILFLIGVQELGKINKNFTKEQKQDLMHIAVCTLLSRSGYYRPDGYDKDGWPHFVELKKMAGMTLEEQEIFLKRHIIQYFEANGNLTSVDPKPANH